MEVVLPSWLVLLAGAALTYTVLRRWTTLDLFRIPSPWGLPWTGQLIQLALNPYRPHEQLLRWHEALGPVVRLRVFHRDLVIIADPKVAAQVLAKGPNECHRRAPEYTTYDVAHGMRGHHAIMTEHNEERWRAIRKGIAPAYSMAAIRENFPTIVRCYAHVCQRIADGTAWLDPPAPVSTAAADAAASKLPPAPLRKSSSIDLSRQSLTRTCSIDNCKSAGHTTAAAAGRAVCIDEEVFAATMQVLTEGFLCIRPELLDVDYQQGAADVGGLVAITNTFLSQPWKMWAYLALPGLCQESRTFHAQRKRLMQLTDTLAHHVEAYRATDAAAAAAGGGGGGSGGGGGGGTSGDAAAAAAVRAGPKSPSNDGASAKGPSNDGSVDGSAAAAGDTSLIGCLSRLREPTTGQLFNHQALQAELFLETVGQESIPWTTAWTLFLLIQHPDVEAKVLQELRGVGLACDGDASAAASALSLDVLKQMPYCTAVLQEAMRMFPAGVMAGSRMTHQTTQVGPYQIPAGVIVFPCLYSILMYSGNWEEPTQFKPERWLSPNYATDPTTGATRFVPFGIGPKACVAQQLAYVQLKVLLALLVSCFTWQLAPCMGGPQGVLSSTVAALELRVEQGMWLLPTPRTH